MSTIVIRSLELLQIHIFSIRCIPPPPTVHKDVSVDKGRVYCSSTSTGQVYRSALIQCARGSDGEGDGEQLERRN